MSWAKIVLLAYFAFAIISGLIIAIRADEWKVRRHFAWVTAINAALTALVVIA